jgi:ankyrin repeat protein
MNGSTHLGDACIVPDNVSTIKQMILDDPLALITFDTTGRLPIHRCVYHDKANANLNALILIKSLSKTTLKKFKQSKVKGIDVRMKELEVSFLEARSKYIEGHPGGPLPPLHVAAMAGAVQNVNTLLKLGANVHSTAMENGVLGITPLFGALNHYEMRKMYPNGCQFLGLSWYDQETRALDTARVLEHAGIDINAKDGTGRSAITAAAESGMPRIVAALAKMGAEVNNRDSGEGYAAHAAAKVGKGFSPLIAAIENGYVDVVRLLIQDLGANPKKKWVTPAGSLGRIFNIGKGKKLPIPKRKTALEYAIEVGNADVISCIESLGSCGQGRMFSSDQETMHDSVQDSSIGSIVMTHGLTTISMNDKRGVIIDTIKESGRHAVLVDADSKNDSKKYNFKFKNLYVLETSCHAVPSKMCAQCKSVKYCCVEHQKADWAKHKARCKKICNQRKSVERQKKRMMDGENTWEKELK